MRLRSLFLALVPFALAACNAGDSTKIPDAVPIESTTFAPALGVNLTASTKTASGMYIRDITVGTGTTLAAGQTVGMYYAGYLVDGSQFDALTSGTPLTFKLGVGQVIKGWDEGLVGMKVGGSRQLVIPATLGYGTAGNGPIPPNAVMVFNVTAKSAQ